MTRPARTPSHRPLLAALALLLGLALPGSAWAQYDRPDYESQQNPSLRLNREARQSAELEQRNGMPVPPGLAFTDQDGNAVTLGDYFDAESGKPVLLQPAYFDCPVLCTKVSQEIAESVAALGLSADEYTVLTVSFVPTETTELAAAKKAASVEHALGHGAPGDVAQSWHFLTGEQDQIDELLATVGFGVGYIEEAEQWSHPDAVIVLSPEGRVNRYLRGTSFNPKTLRLSLVEASENRIGSITDHLFLTCFQFDPVMGKYTPFARGLLRWTALLTVMLIAGGVGFALLRERSRRAEGGAAGGGGGGEGGVGPRPGVA